MADSFGEKNRDSAPRVPAEISEPDAFGSVERKTRRDPRRSPADGNRMDVQCLLQAGALNGECPRWRAEENRLYWVDMRAPALHRLDPASGRDEAWPMPAWIGCYAFADDGAVIAALRGGLYRFDPDNGALRRLADPPYDAQRFCFNDGGCDPKGRFVVGPLFAPKSGGDAPTAGEPGRQPERAPVWRYERGRGRAQTQPLQISNGLAWSPDGRTLYHADTARKTIWAAAYDPDSGEMDAPRVFARVEEGGDGGGPDGAVVDAEGFYICAVFGEACLLRFDPDGRLERRIAVPARYPTMPALGGPGLETMFVTSAAFPIPVAERPRHPADGALYALEAPAPGLPSPVFRPFAAEASS
jgi:sugar lactone lactonase YvrE